MTGAVTPAEGRVAIVARDFRARLLNCSQAGCLFETTSVIVVGTVGVLRVVIDGHELTDRVVVVRCQAIAGAGSVYRVAARFLWTEFPALQNVRHAMGTLATTGLPARP